MIDELRIKCPSCGIILDVKNSRHEAVKKITCPNCKKQLAINFREQEKEHSAPLGTLYYNQLRIDLSEGVNHIPISDCDHLEINVIRLDEGGSKCVVRPLSAEHTVWLNGQPLELDDKVVMALGDELKTGDTTLVYGHPSTSRPSHPAPSPSPKPSLKKHHSTWLLGGITLIAALILVVLLWPKNENEESSLIPEQQRETMDTLQADSVHPSQEQEVQRTTRHHVDKPERTDRAETAPTVEPSYASMNDVELELMARDNVNAQYEYGRRRVNRGDSASIVLGIKYLKKAALGGSSDAQQALQRTFDKLEQKAANGSTTVENIVREQR